MIYQFKIPGNPNTKLRARLGRSGTMYTPQKTRTAEQTVALIAKHLFRNPLKGAVFAIVTFAFEIPPSTSLVKRRAMRGLPHTRKPDGDNTEKLLLDALNELGYDDDCQVALVVKRKIWTHEEGYSQVTMGSINLEAYDQSISELTRWKGEYEKAFKDASEFLM